MSPPLLRRADTIAPTAPPVRLVHLGLGAFFRAHPAWHTAHASDADGWGIAAYAGRRPDLAHDLAAQDGCFTLVTRGPGSDRFEVVSSVARAHAATDHDTWLDDCATPAVAAITITVTEAGYQRRADGHLDRDDPTVAADLASLRRDRRAPVDGAVARLVAGLEARRRADAGPLAVVSCDNLADNGAAVRQVVLELAEALDPTLAEWVGRSAAFPSSVVDRITPRTTAADRALVVAATGFDDRCPVVTEPFAEWVLAGGFPSGRPRWEDTGARFVEDVGPFERRKLWLLNGAHSLLAYAGSALGHRTVAEAFADERCRTWVEQWWDEASRHLDLPAHDLDAYRAALGERFSNARIAHPLAQIAADGSQKLPVRVLPVLRAERADGRLPAASCQVLGAWVAHLQGIGAPVVDARAESFVRAATGPPGEAARQVLDALDPAVAGDDEVVAAVVDAAAKLHADA